MPDPFEPQEQERYESLTFDGESSQATRKDALRAKSGQTWKAILVFALGVVLAGAVVFIGIDETSSDIEFEYQGGFFRGSLAAFIVLAVTFLSYKIATDPINVRGK